MRRWPCEDRWQRVHMLLGPAGDTTVTEATAPSRASAALSSLLFREWSLRWIVCVPLITHSSYGEALMPSVMGFESAASGR